MLLINYWIEYVLIKQNNRKITGLKFSGACTEEMLFLNMTGFGC